MRNPESVDEFAETEVLVSRPGKLPPVEDDASAQSVYFEYVQDIERLLRADASKK
jgi:hypothetical protein